MPERRTKPPSPLRALSVDQKAEVLKRLLKRRPELRSDVERIAGEVLAHVDVDQVAMQIAIAVVACIAVGGGPDDLGGYHEPGEQALDDLEEAVAPLLADMKRRLRLGRVDEARRLCMGIVLGLYKASQAAENMGALDELPEFPFETAQEAIGAYRGRTGRTKRPEPPSFPVSFWLKMHGGWADNLEW